MCDMILKLPSVEMIRYIYWFVYVDPPQHPWVKFYLIMVNELFNCATGFTLLVYSLHEGYWLVGGLFFFLSGFGFEKMLALNELDSATFIPTF